MFEFTMGSYDGAEKWELVGANLLLELVSELPDKYRNYRVVQ